MTDQRRVVDGKRFGKLEGYFGLPPAATYDGDFVAKTDGGSTIS